MINDITTGLRVPSQRPLNPKEYSDNLITLSDLGTNNQLAFTYHLGMRVYCISERKYFEWREPGIDEEGLLANNFIYPAGLIVDGVDYSNKEYNFFADPVIVPPIPIVDTNFAKNDLIFTANRTHDLDSKTIMYDNAKQIKSNVNVTQVTGEASYEEKGFGTLVTDIIKRIYNGASSLILEIRGNKSVKFFGNVWSNGANNTIENNTVYGENAFLANTIGQRNTAFGFEALKEATGNDNTAIGNQALNNTTTGTLNTAVGMEAGFSVTQGSENTMIGYAAGNVIPIAIQNTVVGKSSLTRTIDEVFINSAIQCTHIGADIKSKSGNLNPINEIVIGYSAVSEGNNTIVIGGGNSQTLYIPRHTTIQINSFTGMTQGAMVFNTDLNLLAIYNGTIWQVPNMTAM